ncbi:hypothetical protein G6F45_013791 [Rhizopus arrhizus]|nr:hypothetical protein G6F45_013791 [Rhizopus arrhizus]
MDGRHRAVVAGVHRLQHFQHLGATDFADHDAVRPHAQAVAHQVADAHCAMAFGAADTAFQTHHVRVVERQFGSVLDGDHALIGRHVAGHAPAPWLSAAPASAHRRCLWPAARQA